MIASIGLYIGKGGESESDGGGKRTSGIESVDVDA